MQKLQWQFQSFKKFSDGVSRFEFGWGNRFNKYGKFASKEFLTMNQALLFIQKCIKIFVKHTTVVLSCWGQSYSEFRINVCLFFLVLKILNGVQGLQAWDKWIQDRHWQTNQKHLLALIGWLIILAVVK